MSTAPDCLFCAIVAGRVPAQVVYENRTTLVFRDISPRTPTHLLIIPKTHYETLAELAAADPQELADLFVAAGHSASAEQVAASGYRLISNVGPDSGQEVPHVHLHLLGGTNLGGLVAPPG